MSYSIQEVLARWAYSEICDGANCRHYDYRPNIQELRLKRGSATRFEDLSPSDHRDLAELCVLVRDNMIKLFIDRNDHFDRVTLSKSQISRFLVPQMVSNIPGFLSFAQYVTTHADHPGDARNVQRPPNGHASPTDPLTVSAFQDEPILLDGYHRAVSFWKYAPDYSAIDAYVPMRFLSPR